MLLEPKVLYIRLALIAILNFPDFLRKPNLIYTAFSLTLYFMNKYEPTSRQLSQCCSFVFKVSAFYFCWSILNNVTPW